MKSSCVNGISDNTISNKFNYEKHEIDCELNTGMGS